MVCTRHIKWGTRRRSWKWSGKSLRIRRALYYYIYNFLIWRDFCVLFFSRRPPSTHSHPPTHPPFAIDRLCCLASKNKKVFQHIFYPGTGLIKKCVLRTESLQAPPTRVNMKNSGRGDTQKPVPGVVVVVVVKQRRRQSSFLKNLLEIIFQPPPP
jgi:hypothetical protein